MKNATIFAFILLAFFAIPAESRAQVATVAQDTPLADSYVDQPFAVRKQRVTAELANIYVKLASIHERTSAAALRLEKRGIDTKEAEFKLDLAEASLEGAKATINTLLDPANKNLATIIPVREAVLSAETKLRNARDYLIQSLSALKLTLIASDEN